MNKVPAPNLIPHSRFVARKRELAMGQWIAGLVLIGLVVVIPSALLSIHLRSSKPVESDHSTRFVNDLAELRSVIKPLKVHLAQLEVDSVSQRQAELRIKWTDVLDQLAQTTSDQVRIHSFNATIEPSQTTPKIVILLQVHTSSLSMAREFLFTLEATGLFDEISMVDSRRQSSAPDSLVNSVIRTEIIGATMPGDTP